VWGTNGEGDRVCKGVSDLRGGPGCQKNILGLNGQCKKNFFLTKNISDNCAKKKNKQKITTMLSFCNTIFPIAHRGSLHARNAFQHPVSLSICTERASPTIHPQT
jgi:hypothetical protein